MEIPINKGEIIDRKGEKLVEREAGEERETGHATKGKVD